jgi:hypothetical protein
VDIVVSLVASPQFPCVDSGPVAEVTLNLTGPAGTWAGVLTWNECEDDEPLEVTIYDDMPLAANTTYTWQGLIHFDTVGEYTICFKGVCPGGGADPCEPPAGPGEETILFERCFGSDSDQYSDTGPEGGYCSVSSTVDVDTVAGTEDAITANPVGDTEDATTTDTIENDDEITGDSEAVPFGGCFIATAAYGTAMDEEVQILRQFRDEYLLTNPLGQGLVDFYYGVSPPIAEFITEHPKVKSMVRAGLAPAAAMSAAVGGTTPTQKMPITGLLALVSLVLAVWLRRRRGTGPQCT